MCKIKALPLFVLAFLVLGTLGAASPAYGTEAPAGHGSQEQGKSSAGPRCPNQDPSAPCYAEIYTKSGSLETTSPETAASSQNLQCGVNVYDSLNNLVAQLWETVNATWWSSYWDLNWDSRGTWVVDFRYGWTGLWGPTPTSGRYTYASYKIVNTGGDLRYFGVVWKSYRVNIKVMGYQNWSCYLG